MYICSVENEGLYAEVFDAYEITPDNEKRINNASRRYLVTGVRNLYNILQSAENSGRLDARGYSDLFGQAISGDNSLGGRGVSENRKETEQASNTRKIDVGGIGGKGANETATVCFRTVNSPFFSNARRAVEGIKQEKATP